MTENSKVVFIHWAKAKLAAAENTALLLQKQDPDEYKKTAQLCAQRMQNLYQTEEQVYLLYTIDLSFPEVYHNWLKSKTREAQPCSKCWVSSITKNNHPECIQKSIDYFAAEKSLLDYVCYDMI